MSEGNILRACQAAPPLPGTWEHKSETEQPLDPRNYRRFGHLRWCIFLSRRTKIKAFEQDVHDEDPHEFICWQSRRGLLCLTQGLISISGASTKAQHSNLHMALSRFGWVADV